MYKCKYDHNKLLTIFVFWTKLTEFWSSANQIAILLLIDGHDEHHVRFMWTYIKTNQNFQKEHRSHEYAWNICR